ncbi:MAG: hypothetical protein NVV82_20400 [Sporocytophaga sp.]|nr:hypothetical protein [Sporocytophaga sp.]
MKSRKFFPIKERNDATFTNLTEIKVCHEKEVVSRKFYIDINQYNKMHKALQIAEAEIEELKELLQK